MKTKCYVVISFLFFLSAAGGAWGQNVNGILTGTVTDPSQAAVPGATVTALNRATNDRTVARTSAEGRYTIIVVPGTYDLIVEAIGFKRLEQRGIQVNINHTSRLDLQLQLGEVAEAVTVEGDASILQTETSDLGMVIRPKEVLDLPLSTPGQRRMADTFMLLVPGVSTGRFPDLAWFRGGQWTVNGSQEDSKEILYDGITIGEVHSPGRFWSQAPPPDAIQEFKVLTGAYSAEFGRAGGGIFSIRMRSGGNDFHGSMYEFLRNDAAHARGFFTPTKAKDRQHEFGVTLGGPVYIPTVYDGRNRTFFFFFYNGMRWRTASANELVTVPRREFLDGDFSLLDRPIFDPLTNRTDGQGGVMRDQFPDNRIPPERISAVSRKVAELLPTPMFDRNALNFLGVRTTQSDDDRWQIKIDHILNDRQKLSGFFSTGRFIREGAGPLPQDFFSGFTTRDETAKIVRLSHDYTITPTVHNNLSLGFSRNVPFTGSPTIGQGWPERLGISGVADPNGAFPHIRFGSDVQDGIRLGGEANSLHAQQAFVVSNVLTWVRGRHSIRLGGDVRRHHFNNRVFHRTHGTFDFNSLLTSQPNSPDRGGTGSGTASFLLGGVHRATSLFPTVSIGYRNWYYSAFIQDDYKATRNLTLNLGLRYDVAVPMTEVRDRMSFFDPTISNPGAAGLPGALVFAGEGPGRTGKKTLANTYYKGLGPRLGLAYRLTPKTVLRTGYGIFYGVAGAGSETAVGSRFQLGFNAQPVFESLDNGITAAFFWDEGFPQDFPKPPLIDPTFANGQTIQNGMRPEDGRPPYIQNWHLGLQRELTQNLMVDVAYVGTKGTRLASKMLRPNQLDPDFLSLGDLLTANINSVAAREAGFQPPYPGFDGPVNQALRAFPQYRDIIVPWETLGSSTYHSLQVLTQKRYSKGLVFSVAYTLSKKLSDSSERQNSEGNAGPMDHFNRKLEKSLSSGDATHVVAIGYSYELPFGPGRPLLNVSHPVARKILEGWQVTGMSRYQSGVPLRMGGGNSLPIFSGNRPTFVPGEKIRTEIRPGDFDPAEDVYLNRAAFSNGPRFTFGDVPRTVNARGFPFYDESFSVIKHTKLSESVDLEFRAEFYNFLNRVNFGSPVTNINSSAFGRVSGQVGQPRQMQFGLRLSF